MSTAKTKTRRTPATPAEIPAAPAADEVAEVVQLLGRDDILDAPDYTFDDVEVPEWGGVVRIKSMTGEERDEFEAEMVSKRGNNIKANFVNLRARLVARTAIDAAGNTIFTRADVTRLGKKSAAALNRCFSAAQRLSGLTEDDVEELTENFGDDPNGPSTSG